MKFLYLADPGEARGCSTNTFVINSFIHSVSQSVSQPFPPTALRRRHAQTVRDSSSSDQDLSKSPRASTSDEWFKSNGHFTEGVDFACLWSFSGGGYVINGATPSSLLNSPI